MKPRARRRYACSICLTVSLLTACGGSQPLIGVPLDRVVQTRTIRPVNGSPVVPGRTWTEAQYKVASALMFVVNWSTQSGFGNVVVYHPKTKDPAHCDHYWGIGKPHGDCVTLRARFMSGATRGVPAGFQNIRLVRLSHLKRSRGASISRPFAQSTTRAIFG